MWLSLATANAGRTAVMGAAAARNSSTAVAGGGHVGRVLTGHVIMLRASPQPEMALRRCISGVGGAWCRLTVPRKEQLPLQHSLSSPSRRCLSSGSDRAMTTVLARPSVRSVAGQTACTHRTAGFSTQGTNAADRTDNIKSTSSSEQRAETPVGTLEERIARLEELVTAQETKIADVEKTAKAKGGMMQKVMQYGAPFALWYAFCWLSMWFSIYVLLEAGIVSWQDSLRPLFEGFGLEAWVEKIDPSMGNVVIAFLVNECLEAIRFPLVLATGVPVIKAVRSLRGLPPVPPP